jgi:hypothetical protein
MNCPTRALTSSRFRLPNWLWRPLNKSFVGDVADEPWAMLRRLLPGLRHENRPVNLLTARTLRDPLPSVVKLDPAV